MKTIALVAILLSAACAHAPPKCVRQGERGKCAVYSTSEVASRLFMLYMNVWYFVPLPLARSQPD